jgi:LysM repeat protein
MRRPFLCLFLLAILPACAGNAGTSTAFAPLVPYQTSTPSWTPSAIPTLTGIELPTPTSISYTVVQGDTLIGIAGRFGITLEALLAANPGVQLATLTIGTTLLIPAANQNSLDPTPTPVPLTIKQKRCWPEKNGGLWCFALLQNDYDQAVENLSVQFTLFDARGMVLDSLVTFALLDTLPPGKSMPLAVQFPPPLPTDWSIQVQQLSANRLFPGDTRYLQVMLDNTLVNINADGRTAQVSGRVISTSAGAARTLWLLATAYDADGNVVGMRRWESPSTLVHETPVGFDFMISSLGAGIDRVEFLLEARP